MIQKVKGIVLHHIKYKESSAIVHVYTDKYGRQAYLVNSIRGKRSRFPGNLLQPLTLLEIEAYHKEGKDLQRLKEMRTYIAYRSIPFDHQKSSQALFLAEVLYKALQGEDPDAELFEFLENSLQLFDMTEDSTVNFHLLFLVQLTKYLGFYPENNFSRENDGFDMRNGQFATGTSIHPDYFQQECSELLSGLLGSGFNNLSQISVNQELRKQFMLDMMEYYKLHISGFGSLRSLPVLNEIYSDDN